MRLLPGKRGDSGESLGMSLMLKPLLLDVVAFPQGSKIEKLIRNKKRRGSIVLAGFMANFAEVTYI